jgi:hypothetical protein
MEERPSVRYRQRSAFAKCKVLTALTRSHPSFASPNWLHQHQILLPPRKSAKKIAAAVWRMFLSINIARCKDTMQPAHLTVVCDSRC